MRWQVVRLTIAPALHTEVESIRALAAAMRVIPTLVDDDGIALGSPDARQVAEAGQCMSGLRAPLTELASRLDCSLAVALHWNGGSWFWSLQTAVAPQSDRRQFLAGLLAETARW